jgi:hypothetical protein
MKATELRIGNWVKLGLHEFAVELPDIRRLKSWPDQYKPIPLTEEWLIKFGFEIYEFDHKENQYRFKERLLVIRDGLFCDYGTSVVLKHVHQLQNLYFALTGEELESTQTQKI